MRLVDVHRCDLPGKRSPGDTDGWRLANLPAATEPVVLPAFFSLGYDRRAIPYAKTPATDQRKLERNLHLMRYEVRLRARFRQVTERYVGQAVQHVQTHFWHTVTVWPLEGLQGLARGGGQADLLAGDEPKLWRRYGGGVFVIELPRRVLQEVVVAIERQLEFDATGYREGAA